MKGMKRTRSDKAGGGIKWDETNLEENEKLKAELNPRKIDEPKTPYVGPYDEQDHGKLAVCTCPCVF